MGKRINIEKPKEERLGQKGVNNNGEEITIVAYRKYNDIDIQFADGVIVEKRNYGKFLIGSIAYPKKDKIPKEERLGLKGKNISGEEMTIIAYRKYEDIDIQFKDGVIVKNQNYGNFLRGSIAHPIRYEESFAYHIEVELGLDINKIWNFEKNTVSPYEITKQSNKKVWLYCLDKDYHNDKGGYETQCNNFYRGCRCYYCTHNSGKVHKLDSLGYLYPQIAQMIINDKRNNMTIEDLYKISPCSSIFLYFKCDNCNKESSKKIYLPSAIRYKFCCEYCSDGISIPEKFMLNIFKQLNIKFITQLNKSILKWCKKYRYDFYIPSLNMIIEINGRQHYTVSFENKGGKTLKEEQENDKLKKELALNNNIDNYIIIDCRHSEINWLRENIVKELNNYFDLSNINWELAWENSLKSLVWEVKKLVEEGKTNKEIAEILNVNRKTIERYKKQLGFKTKNEIKQENILKTKMLLEQGKTLKEIAEILNVCRDTITSYKKELNL